MKHKSNCYANAHDIIVGKNIRLYRTLQGMSQEALGKHLGISYQQVQKYEVGLNRISAGKLMQVANILGVAVQALFDNEEDASAAPVQTPAITGKGDLPLFRRYHTLTAPQQRAIADLVRVMAGAEPEHTPQN